VCQLAPLLCALCVCVICYCSINQNLKNHFFKTKNHRFLSKTGLYLVFVCAYLQESDSVRAGLLMEQAALFLLQIPPPGLRKFAFTMVLAGLKYFQHAQRSLGIRCYL